MEDDTPPPAPAPQMIAPPPSPSQLTEASLQSQLKYAPEFFKMQQEQLPQYAQLQTDIQKSQAPQLSQINLEQQKVYGPQLIEAALANVKSADPQGFAIREALGKKTLEDLNLGGQLSPEEQRSFEQDIRSGQVARGVGTGFREALDESQILGSQRFNRDQQRRANAASFLAGQTPQASFTNVNQAGKTAPVGTQDVSGFAGQFMMPSTNQLIGSQMQGYNTMADFTMGTNQLMNRQHEFGVQNTTMNPALQGLSAFGGFASGLGGAAIGKWG